MLQSHHHLKSKKEPICLENLNNSQAGQPMKLKYVGKLQKICNGSKDG